MLDNDLYYVSVSLRSIIHSYLAIIILVLCIYNCFRLLTEYYSFLFGKSGIGYTSINVAGFRLLTEYYSFLWKNSNWDTWETTYKFPSPCGV